MQALHDLIPQLGVVHAPLPRVADVDEPFSPGVTFAVEIIVPSLQFRKGVLEKLFRPLFVLGMTVDVKSSRGVNGRLDHPGGLAVFGGVGAFLHRQAGLYALAWRRSCY